MKAVLLSLISTLFLVAGPAFAAAPTATGLLEERYFQPPAPTAPKVGYLFFRPQSYEKSPQRWPVLLYLHGTGDSGTNLAKLNRNGPPKYAKAHPDFPFLLVCPQHHFSTDWDNTTLIALLDYVISNYRADPHRIYLTGLSMGGGVTWMLAAAHPEKFAAIVPVSGYNLGDARKLTKLPIWVFHGAKDSIIPVDCSRKMVAAIQAAGGHVKYTEFPGAHHNVWTRTYENPELYQWLLEQKR